MQVVIREGRPSEASAISDFITPLAAKFIAHEFAAPARKLFLATFSHAAVDKYIANGFRYHLAESEGTMVGVVATRQNRHVYHLFVAESAQRSGVGRSLWNRAREAARESGYRGDFTVNSSRFAVGFYERLGFVRDGHENARDGIVSVPLRYPVTCGPTGGCS